MDLKDASAIVTGHASRCRPSHRAPVLATILVSYLMIVPDISIVITALPEID